MWIFKAKFVHDPSSFDPIRSSILVKNQSLSHPYDGLRPWIEHRSIFSGGFPVAGDGGTVSSEAGCILTIPEAKEVPLVRVQLRHVYKLIRQMFNLVNNNSINRNYIDIGKKY